jgi:hypothetical protein
VVTDETMGEKDPLLARFLAAATAGAPVPSGPRAYPANPCPTRASRAPVASRSRQQAQAVAYRARPHYPVADCPQHFAPVARHPGRGTIKPCGEHSCNSSRDIHRVGATSEDGRSPGSGSCPARAT